MDISRPGTHSVLPIKIIYHVEHVRAHISTLYIRIIKTNSLIQHENYIIFWEPIRMNAAQTLNR